MRQGRTAEEIRPLKIETGYVKHPEGSVLISLGDTRVICSASVEETVPTFLEGQDCGWITAEYSMLPRATASRNIREAAKGRQGGRTKEIQRIIGRSLRAMVELDQIGPRTILLDCDVIQADGGTRTASITGAFVALIIALDGLVAQNLLSTIPVKNHLAAVSVGKVGEKLLLDLDGEEDFHALTDMNIAGTGQGEFVEIQGTGESHPFTREEMDHMIFLAEKGIREMIKIQAQALRTAHVRHFTHSWLEGDQK